MLTNFKAIKSPTKIPEFLAKKGFQSFTIWYLQYSCDCKSVQNLVGKADIEVFKYLLKLDLQIGTNLKANTMKTVRYVP